MNWARIAPKTEQYLMVLEFPKHQRFVTAVMECEMDKGAVSRLAEQESYILSQCGRFLLVKKTDLQFESNRFMTLDQANERDVNGREERKIESFLEIEYETLERQER